MRLGLDHMRLPGGRRRSVRAIPPDPGPPADPLAQYYGIGAEKISFDMPLHDPAKMTVDADGYVSAVQHQGGAGAYFNATASGAARPLWDAAAKGLRFTAANALTLASPADLAGVHALMALRLPPQAEAANTNLFVTGSTGIMLYVPTSGPRLRMVTSGFSHYPVSAAPSLYGRWLIAEYRFHNGAGSIIINGVIHDTMAGTVVQTLVNTLRGPASATLQGVLGRVIGVVCGSGTPATPEPAVLAARNLLAQQYGVTL